MKHFSILILSILLIGVSCKKKELAFNFFGTVYSTHNQEKIDNVTIRANVYNIGEGASITQETTTTDSEGNYELSIKRGRFEKIVFSLERDNYFKDEKVFLFDQLNNKETNEYNFGLDAKSWVKFRIRNIYSQRPNDVLKIQKLDGRADCEGCWENGSYYTFTGVIDTTFLIPNTSGSYFKYYFWLNNNEWSGADSVLTTAFEEIEKSITY